MSDSYNNLDRPIRRPGDLTARRPEVEAAAEAFGLIHMDNCWEQGLVGLAMTLGESRLVSPDEAEFLLGVATAWDTCTTADRMLFTLAVESMTEKLNT